MYCAYCGKFLEDSSKFCPACGAPVGQKTGAERKPYMSSEPHMDSYPQAQPYNVLSIVGLILAFFMPLVGFILSLVALHQLKTSGEQGHGVALAGAIIGGVIMLLYVLLFFAGIFASISFFSLLFSGLENLG